MTMMKFLVLTASILLKLLVTYLMYTFVVWLEAPMWLIIGVTAAAWVETKFLYEVK